MKNVIISTYLIVSLLLCFYCGTAAAQEVYTLAVPMVDGLDATNMTAYLEKMSVILTKRLGVQIKTRPLVYRYGDSVLDMVMKDFKEGNSDIGYVYGREYAAYRNAKDNAVVPLFTLSMFKSRIMKQCFYTRAGEFKDAGGLRGGKWAGSTYLPARYMLYSAGVDEPLEKFFSSISYESDAPLKNLVDRMKRKEIDVFSTYEVIMNISGELKRKDSFLEPLYCRDYDHTWVFVARREVPVRLLQQIREIVLNAHKDPDFATFKFAFQLIEGKFVEIQEESLDQIGDICRLVEKKGWEAESRAFYKKYRAEGEKPRKKAVTPPK